MASQQDPLARPPPTHEGKAAPKRPLDSSPSSGSDINKPAPKLQKLDLPPTIAKQDPNLPRIGLLNHPPALGGDFRVGNVQQRQLELAGNVGFSNEKAKPMPVKEPVGRAHPEGRKSPAEQTPSLSRKPEGALAEVRLTQPVQEPAKVHKTAETPVLVSKVSRPEAAVSAKLGIDTGAREEAEGDAGKKERAEGTPEVEGGDKEQLGLVGKRILRPRQASAPPQGQRSRLRHREGEAG